MLTEVEILQARVRKLEQELKAADDLAYMVDRVKQTYSQCVMGVEFHYMLDRLNQYVHERSLIIEYEESKS